MQKFPFSKRIALSKITMNGMFSCCAIYRKQGNQQHFYCTDFCLRCSPSSALQSCWFAWLISAFLLHSSIAVLHCIAYSRGSFHSFIQTFTTTTNKRKWAVCISMCTDFYFLPLPSSALAHPLPVCMKICLYNPLSSPPFPFHTFHVLNLSPSPFIFMFAILTTPGAWHDQPG